MGYYDRPLYSYRSVFDYRGGRYGGGYSGHGWSFVNKDHFRSVPVERTRLRVEDVRATANQGSLFESGAILDRELRPVAVGTTAMSRATQLSNRATIANAPNSASSSRAGLPGLRRGAQGMPSTLERSSASGGYAVPRFTAGSGSSSATGSRTAVPFTGKSAEVTGRSTEVTGRTPEPTGRTSGEATGGVSNRGGSPSRFGLVRSGVQRGEAIPGSNEGSASGRPPTIGALGTSRAPASTIESSRGTAAGRTPAVPSAPSRLSGPSGASVLSREVTRGPAVDRSMGRSAGSRDFFGRGPSSLVGPRSENAGSRATPRAPQVGSPSGNRSSQTSSRTSGGSGTSNRNDNRGSSRPRN